VVRVPPGLFLGSYVGSVCQTMSMALTYWLDLFTVETWKEFLDHDGKVSGFSEKRRKVVQGIKPGDYLLCYLTRVSRFVGLLEVVDKPFLMRSRSGVLMYTRAVLECE
jgi:hypothetical protein